MKNIESEKDSIENLTFSSSDSKYIPFFSNSKANFFSMCTSTFTTYAYVYTHNSKVLRNKNIKKGFGKL